MPLPLQDTHPKHDDLGNLNEFKFKTQFQPYRNKVPLLFGHIEWSEEPDHVGWRMAYDMLDGVRNLIMLRIDLNDRMLHLGRSRT